MERGCNTALTGDRSNKENRAEARVGLSWNGESPAATKAQSAHVSTLLQLHLKAEEEQIPLSVCMAENLSAAEKKLCREVKEESPEAEETKDENEQDGVSEEEMEGGYTSGSDEDWTPPPKSTKKLTKKQGEGEKNLLEEDRDDIDKDNHTETTSNKDRIKQLCTECGSFFSDHSHICQHKAKPYACRVCGKRCDTELALMAHSNTHKERLDHTCKFCFDSFKSKKDKRTHEQAHLDQEKPYKCKDCTLTFDTHRKRQIHMKIHGQQEFKCDYDRCRFTFWSKDNLEKHMLIHKGGARFKCSLCDRGFNQAANLKSHMRHLHMKVKPFKCPNCDKPFSHRPSLRTHIQRHHP